ncbi:MAG: 2-oxoglutarate dehydrogenase E1 component [Longimicrobiales bacterium]|nr:2-oxoglutarate dehydrogenase E1 component [Longimicrobiales bacterium]
MKDDTLFDSPNVAYAQAMFEEYARNPDAVSEEWRRLFENGAELAIAEGLLVPDQLQSAHAVPRGDAPPAAAEEGPAAAEERPAAAPPPSSDEDDGRGDEAAPAAVRPEPAGPVAEPQPSAAEAEPDEEVAWGTDGSASRRLLELLPAVSRATALVQAFRDHGHRLAHIDPLGSDPPGHPQLSPAFHGTSTEELHELPASLILAESGASADDRSVADALAELGEIYADTIGYEFEHLDDHEKVDWLWAQVEAGRHRPEMSDEKRVALLRRISEAEGLEQFLHRTYLGQKRFSLEGNDMLVPMLDLVVEESAGAGAQDVVLGMAHRGRLNVLTHTLGVSYGDLLAEFEGPSIKGGALDIEGTGDVKYHHGARGRRTVEGSGEVEITLAPNPSHLEFVNPVVLGMARAKLWADLSRGEAPKYDAVVPILIHGDAAFAAEGVVAETLNMARLEGYEVGGTIHVIVNNQIGFTTDPREGRSTAYASDLAKGYGIPIVHVNADDPEACLAVVRLAMAYRREYHDDFVIDLVGYRRHGHNEGDEPAYTQPVRYDDIEDHPTVRALYAADLVEDGILTEDDAAVIQDEIAETLREAQDHVREHEAVGDDKPDAEREVPVVPDTTGVDLEVLERVNGALTDVPEAFTPHPKLWRQIQRRAGDFGADKTLDWGHAETLAFGSLLMEGIPVRLTGQDSERGTFSHRHAILHDVETGEEFVPLSTIAEAPFEIYNSPLTETAVVGFEYGYSVACDNDAVLWEAQFGDFVNVAQVMIDQFLSSGHQKWGQYSRLVLLLPHGYEGQGPEHSSARLERFLQLCAEDNMRVTYPTTPAQYFHMLRRQALRRPERPMIVMTPKSLLRHPRATSEASELTTGNFRHVLEDPTVEDPATVQRLVLCSGKVYYDIQGHDRREEASNTAVGRLELLYPFPEAALEELVGMYPNLGEVVWAQEEPRNMGALTFVGPRLRAVVPRKIPLSYAARPERASPAEGKSSNHARHQNTVILEALGLEPEETPEDDD